MIEKPKYNMDEIMVINFVSQDSTVNRGIKCLPTDIFAEVEEKLYQQIYLLKLKRNYIKYLMN